MSAEAIGVRWRRGRKVGRTIYAQLGPDANDDDLLIGLMDSPELAAAAVTGHNRWLERQQQKRRP